jgi:hypothetical protein
MGTGSVTRSGDWNIQLHGVMFRMRSILRPAIAGLMLTLAPAAAFACSCAQPSAEGLMQSAPAVFTGVATTSAPATQGEAITTFTVVEGFKGVRAGELVRVRHRSGSSASCGVQFAVGATHTLSTYREEVGTSLFASLCNAAIFRSREGEQIIQRMRQFGR